MSKTTTDHEEIKKWATRYKGRPAIIGTNIQDRNVGIRIDFPGRQEEVYLDEGKDYFVTTWDDFFHVFERKNFALMYDDEDKDRVDLTRAYRFTYRNEQY